jgi:hypothetical protein
MKRIIEGMMSWFEIRRNRNFAVSLSFGLHAVAGVLMLHLPKESMIPVWFQLGASISLIPLILLAESLKKVFIYVLLAISAVPVFVTGLLIVVFVIGIAREGLGAFKMQAVTSMVMVPAVVCLMFLSILWPYLAGALAVRIGTRAFLRKPL